jgi:hypothetical protein
MAQWEEFLSELKFIEAKYWQYFRHTSLKDHFILNEDENQTLRFAFKKTSDLCSDIKNECLRLFKKYQLNQRMA